MPRECNVRMAGVERLRTVGDRRALAVGDRRSRQGRSNGRSVSIVEPIDECCDVEYCGRTAVEAMAATVRPVRRWRRNDREGGDGAT